MDIKWLDSLTFEPIPAPTHYYDIPRLTVNEKGHMTMNSACLRQVGKTRCFSGEISTDGRCLKLQPDESGELHFSPASGVCLHRDFSSHLKERGIQLPAIYTLEWLPERDLWVGTSNDLPKPPKTVVFSRKPARRRTK